MRRRIQTSFEFLLTSGFLSLLALQLCCGGSVDQRYYREVDHALRHAESGEAAELVKEAGREVYGDRNRLLYHLDLGFALHVSGNFAASASQFESADGLALDLYTRSLSAEAGSLFTSDLNLPYYGEEFEHILINVFNGLNYAMMGQPEEALVEVRRADVKFRDFAQQGVGRYGGDPFAHYLSGMLYENAGELDDALISYRRAYKAYLEQEPHFRVSPPRGLLNDLTGLARRLGRELELDLDGIEAPSHDGGGEVVVVHYVGPGPRKKEHIVEVSLGQGFAIVQSMEIQSEEQNQVRKTLSVAKGLATTTQVTIAYPVFDQPALACHQGIVDIPGCGRARSELVENVSLIARLNLEDRMSRQWSRIVSRAVLKFVTARAAGKLGEKASGNQGVGLLVQVGTQAALSASESADVRGWHALPGKIHMTRLVCPEGEYEVLANHVGTDGYDRAVRRFPGVKVKDGKKTFLLAVCF